MFPVQFRKKQVASHEARLGSWLAVIGVAILSCSVEAATVVHSRSDQFVIHSPYATTPTLGSFGSADDSTRVALAPDPLAVSCERIKAGVLRELDLADHWRGKVHVWIKPGLRIGTPPGLVSTRYADGWQYTLELPEQIEPAVLVRAVVQALVTEIANRQGGMRPADVPLWLVEGLSASAASTVGPDLVVAPTRLRARVGDAMGQLDNAQRTQVGAQNLPEIRAWFFDRPFLSFAELSQPNASHLAGENLTTYRHCAQLLLRELQGLPQGRRCLRALVSSLTRSLNWQTAFLRAFSSHFGRLLDVEKWWAVSMQSFLQGDQPNAWPREVSLDKLDELLGVRVEVQARPRAPRRVEVMSLQEYMAKTAFRDHREVLRARVRRLESMQRKVTAEVVPLVQSYLGVLDGYLTRRAQSGRNPTAKRIGSLPGAMVLREAIRQLDELDRQRARLE